MKKMLSLMLACAMTLSLAACGSAGSAPAASGSAASSTSGTIEPVTLKIYSPGNENSVPTKTIIEYARLVSEASEVAGRAFNQRGVRHHLTGGANRLANGVDGAAFVLNAKGYYRLIGNLLDFFL